MRKLVAIVLLMSAVILPVAAKKLPPEELIIQRVIEAEKLADELFSLSLEWIAKNFRSAKSVIEVEDRASGKIIGRGMIPVTYTIVPVDTFFTLTIEVKDGKARITVENAFMEMYASGRLVRDNLELKAQMNKFRPEVERLFDSYEQAIRAKSEAW